jgi:hypothetical protein
VIRFICKYCRKRCKTPDRFAERLVRCPRCYSLVRVAGPSAPVLPTPVARQPQRTVSTPRPPAAVDVPPLACGPAPSSEPSSAWRPWAIIGLVFLFLFVINQAGKTAKGSPQPGYQASPGSGVASPVTSGPYYDYTYRPAVGYHYIQGYYRRDGTYVRGHNRTNPDGNFWNNWSSRGNVNPYTGKVGSRRP